MSSSTSEQTAELRRLLRADAWRLRCLEVLRDVAPHAWIGAGFVRAAVFDALCGVTTELGDIDVIYFGDGSRQTEAIIEAALAQRVPEAPWSVHDQARMHLKTGDAPYKSVEHAITHWPEVAAAVAVRLGEEIDVLAPLGLDDLFAVRIRPTPHMASKPGGMDVFRGRIEAKRWSERWPGVEVAHSPSWTTSNSA